MVTCLQPGVKGHLSAFRINPRLKNAVLREGDLCDRDRRHASRYNVETTITAARTKTGQSLHYERLLTKEGSWADELLASRRNQLRKRQIVTLELPSKKRYYPSTWMVVVFSKSRIRFKDDVRLRISRLWAQSLGTSLVGELHRTSERSGKTLNFQAMLFDSGEARTLFPCTVQSSMSFVSIISTGR